MDASRTRQDYNEAFLQELARLNGAQRAAVEQIEGPVMVVAGPGTGKTQLLAARIGNILLETDTLPENILCLTFTDAGVLAMRERVLQFIGPSAHRVHIYTFHAFCNAVIQDNLELFGRQDLEPISDLERIDLIRSLLDDLDVDHPLKKGKSNPYYYESHLRDLFQRLKKEDWTADFVCQQIDEYLASLNDRPEFRYKRRQSSYQKGDLREAKVRDMRARMETLRAAVQLYPLYEKAKSQARRYDFDDMIGWVLRAFEQNEFLLRTYQEKYLYVLVDEYQDTNGAQNEVLLQLIQFWETPNVFIVGDDDQSIYEFQGARLKNLSDFFHRYEQDIELVVLRENYRSTQPILDAAGILINKNEIRIVNRLKELGLDKTLETATPEQTTGSTAPILAEYPNRFQEEADIVRQIEQFLTAGIPAREIAVIYAQHRQGAYLAALLGKKGIPYVARRNVNLLDLPLIQRICQMLRYFRMERQQAHSGEGLLFQLSHFDFLQIPTTDLARISLALSRMPEMERLPWRDALRDRQFLEKLPIKAEAGIVRWGELLETLLQESANLPLPLFLERLINQSGLLLHVTEQEDKVGQVQALFAFFDFVRTSCDQQPDLDLAGLLEMLDRMTSNNLSLDLVQLTGAGEGVTLVTAHSAKGLEFSHVFLLDCVKDYWEPRIRQNGYRFVLPDTLTFSGEEDALEARRRLFYVGMTRARRFLHLSYARQDDRGKALQRSLFVDELQEAGVVSFVRQNLTPDEVVDAQLIHLGVQRKPVLPGLDRKAIEAYLQDFRLSVSSLNSYLSCPLGFYFEFVLNVPRMPSAAATYGIAMHQALRRLFESMLASRPQEFPPEKALMEYFETELSKQKSRLPETTHLRLLETGRRNLGRFYRQNLGRWHKQARVEYTVREVEMDGIPLTGTIDKIEFHEYLQVGIVDYKTGQYDPARFKRPGENNPQGGNYWRQLVFYKILYECMDRSSRSARFGTVHYLDPDVQGEFPEYRLDFEPADVESVRQMITDAYRAIRNQQFYEGCGKPDCQWCAFVRRDLLKASLSNPETETLDDSR